MPPAVRAARGRLRAGSTLGSPGAGIKELRSSLDFHPSLESDSVALPHLALELVQGYRGELDGLVGNRGIEERSQVSLMKVDTDSSDSRLDGGADDVGETALCRASEPDRGPLM